MWKVYSLKQRRFLIKIIDCKECSYIDECYVDENKLDEVLSLYSKKYDSPLYDIKVYELMDLDWNE